MLNNTILVDLLNLMIETWIIIFELQNNNNYQKMQKLKIYLSKQGRQNKSTMQEIKQKIFKSKSNGWQTKNYQNITKHHISHNNLSKSSNMRNLTHLHDNKKKISKHHNRSYQELLQLRTQFNSYLDHPIRYDRNKQQEKHDNKIIKQLKKNSKLAISETRICNKSQPSFEIERSGRRNNKSQKHLDFITHKHIKQNNHNFVLNLHKVQQPKPKVKDQGLPQSSKNNFPQKIPNKKRSKSAHMEGKKGANQGNKNQKQKRSCSLRKTSQDHNKQKDVSLFKKIKGLKEQIQFTCMFRTRKGVQISNPNKVNQDRFIIKENYSISQNKNFNLYAVADGHGPYGHMVSSCIMSNLLKKIQLYLKQNRSVKSSLWKSYKDLQAILVKNIDFNADFSGSTLVTVFVQNNKTITCANVGDSRAIVARQLNKNNWEVIRLSNDHKPHLDEQKKRILAQGGRVQAVYDENGKSLGPLRVWLPNKQIQGLAMSRSLGDNVSKPIGVTNQPEILTHELTKDDKFILLASDGVWQFLSNYQILSLIIPYYRQNKLQDACQALLRQAYKSWTIDDNSVIDDITFILIFLTSYSNQHKENVHHHKQKFSSVKVYKEPPQFLMFEKQSESLFKNNIKNQQISENGLFTEFQPVEQKQKYESQN